MRSSTDWRLEIPHLALILSVVVVAAVAGDLRAQTSESGAGSEAASGEATAAPTSPGTGVAAAGADGAETEAAPALKGKHARRAARISQWIEMLKHDRRRIYDQHGFPTYRHYELEFETRTEHWYYLAENREFVFSGDRLVGQQ